MERKTNIRKWIIRLLIAGAVSFGLVAIYNVTMIGNFIYKLDKSSEEYTNRPAPDPACFVSDKLRVKVGGTIFAVPRRELSGLRPYPPSKEHASIPEDAENICQKAEDAPIELIAFSLKPNITPLNCDAECQYRKENSYNRALLGAVINQNNLDDYGTDHNKSQEEYIDSCKADPYFNTCNYYINYKNVRFGFQYYLQAFPLERIEETEKLAENYLKEHDITGKESKENGL